MIQLCKLSNCVNYFSRGSINNDFHHCTLLIFPLIKHFSGGMTNKETATREVDEEIKNEWSKHITFSMVFNLVVFTLHI
jgi:hypothetical protein